MQNMYLLINLMFTSLQDSVQEHLFFFLALVCSFIRRSDHERSDDQKCVCGSQATLQGYTLENGRLHDCVFPPKCSLATVR